MAQRDEVAVHAPLRLVELAREVETRSGSPASAIASSTRTAIGTERAAAVPSSASVTRRG